MTDQNERSFPALETYLSLLPHGLDSYPECQQKGSVARSVIAQWHDLPSFADRLPPTLAHLIRNPPPASLWIPEVHGMALWALASDVLCNNELPRYVEFSRQQNRALLSSPIYRLVFGVLGGRLTVRAIATAWSTFHKGVDIDAALDAGPSGVLHLRAPPHLISEPHSHGFGTAFSEGLRVAGFADASVDVDHWTPTVTTYRCSW